MKNNSITQIQNPAIKVLLCKIINAIPINESLLVMFCLAASFVSTAQTYTIGNGTINNTISGISPFSSSFSDNRNQIIYLASELTAQGASAGNILSIALDISTVGSPAPANVTIKIANTIADNNTSGFEVVTGEVTAYTASVVNISSTGWYTFTFSTPFVWNGTSNIAVEICRDNASAGSNFGVRSTQLSNSAAGRRNYGFFANGVAGCSMTSGSTASPGDRTNRPNMRFTFGAVCTTPTVGGTLTITPNSTVVNDIVQLNLTGNGGNVLRYEYSFDNFATTPVSIVSSLNTLNVFVPFNQPQIWYRSVSKDGFCPIGYSNVVVLNLRCAPLLTTGTNSGDYITNVTFNTIANNSTKDAGADAYQNFSNLSTQVCAGHTYSLSVSGTNTSGANQGFAAWIDWNGDGVFSTSENVLISAPTPTATISVVVPNNLFSGSVKMRVLCARNQTPTNNACAAFDYQRGEIEEYTIIVNQSTTNTITQSACNSYTLNNITYNATGQYTQTLTNSIGCDSIITLNLSINNMVLNTSSTTATLGFANGSATVTPSGGVPPFTYQWNDSFEQTTATAYGVFPGTYICVVTDGNGCSAQVSVTVTLNLAVPLTKVRTQFCNTGGYALNSVISCDVVPNATNYRWEFKPVGGPALPEYTRGSSNYNVRPSWISGIQQGVTYEVRVKAFVNGQWGSYGTMCTIGISGAVQSTQVLANYSPNNANTNLAYAFCDNIRAENVELADTYEWEFVGPNTIVTQSSTYFVNVGSIPNLQVNSTYQVRVRARVNSVWGAFATQLPVNIASTANTSIWTSHCGSTRTLNQAIAAYNVCGADSYTFRYQHASEADRVVVRPTYTCGLNLVTPALTPGQTYSVSVKVSQGGVMGNYSTACDITIAGPQAQGISDDIAITRNLIFEVGQLGIYPNPNAGSEVRVELGAIAEGYHDVAVTIYDIYGKLMTRDVFGNEGTELSRLVRFEQELATGMYLVHVTVDGDIFATEKLVVR